MKKNIKRFISLCFCMYMIDFTTETLYTVNKDTLQWEAVSQ